MIKIAKGRRTQTSTLGFYRVSMKVSWNEEVQAVRAGTSVVKTRW